MMPEGLKGNNQINAEWASMNQEIDRTGDDLRDVGEIKNRAFNEFTKVDPNSPQHFEALQKLARAHATENSLKEANELYPGDANTHEENIKNVGVFGDVESSGFEQPVPPAIGSILDDGISKEVYPQQDGEDSKSYELRIKGMEQESYRHKQGNEVTDVNIAKINMEKSFRELEMAKKAFEEIEGKISSLSDEYAQALHRLKDALDKAKTARDNLRRFTRGSTQS